MTAPTDSAGWRWFPWGVLRSAGFPIRWIEPLRSGAVGLAADSLIACERDIAHAAEELFDIASGIANRPQRRRIYRAANSRRVIDAALSESIESYASKWNALLERSCQATSTFQRAYNEERPVSTEHLLRILEHDGIRRALLWQNRRIVPTLLTSKNSWNERALLKYVSRYTTKNDTIGFFGPVKWIRLSNESGYGKLRWGPAVTRATLLSLETWPIAAIAGQLAENERVRPWLAPRRSALCRVQGHAVFMPPDRRVEATGQDIEILRLCDGRRSAREIATQVALDDFTALDALQRRGLITWTLDCPMRTNPERTIAELAARVEDREIRTAVESHLTWLISVSTRLRERMETSSSLAMVLDEIDEEFERGYSRESVHRSGEYYAGRTLTYIDCERDVELALSADLLNALMQGLLPILLSLRWYTYTIVQQLLPAVAALVPLGHTRPLAAVFPHAVSLVWSAIQAAAAQYRGKWQRILDLNARQRIVRFDAAGLTTVVATEFDAPHPGWPMARVHNPDILIAAKDHAELARGKCTLVLGEVHASLPSMFQSGIFALCPEPDRVRHMFHSLMIAPPILNEVSPRLNLGEFFSDAAQLLLPEDPVTHVNARPIADFDVCHASTGVRVQDVTTGQRWSFPVFFDAILSRATFQIDPFDRPGDAHSPRIVVGDLVVAREKWRVTAGTFGVAERRRADPGDNARNFLAVRRWARENDVPRYVFAKSSAEPKPIFLDLDSQSCVELFAHLLKRSAAADSLDHVSIVEMLPDPGGCWLRDSAGERYTSEMRLLAVDPTPYPEDLDE